MPPDTEASNYRMARAALLGEDPPVIAAADYVLDDPVRPNEDTGQIVAPHPGRLRWLVETEAAADLER